ncbi:Mitochondrial import inner membrane translocase subunit tim23 [Coemansia sp. RSA 1821]|nr:Mitochondrial import inner membrane translocase subunit tim23 [Coemansia sp. RSA 1821]
MSIFSVFSRGEASAQEQQQQGHNAAAPTNAYTTYSPQQTSVPSAPQPPSAASIALDQMQGGVSDILGQVDLSSSKLNPITNPGGIEYLTIEDGPVHTGGVMPSRGWSDDLCYGTGTMYILGLSTGGAWGFMEGIRAQHGNFKLRLNSVLNSMTRRGPFVGNSMGILAMFYNSINSMLGSYRGIRDQYNNVGAAAISGMLFKIGSGPRASLISALVCSGVVGVYQASVFAYNNYKQKKLDNAMYSPSEPQLSSPENAM